MGKEKAGLPDSFELQVENPVELGDYLDEDFGSAKNETKGASNADELRKKTGHLSKSKLAHTTPPESGAEIKPSPTVSLKKRRPVEPPRKQVNMKPETLRKAEELLRLVQEQGPQRDAAASEMFDAVVAALYEAKDGIDLSDLPKRGRWGTPTAAAFVTALSKTFALAIYENRKSTETLEQNSQEQT